MLTSIQQVQAGTEFRLKSHHNIPAVGLGTHGVRTVFHKIMS